MTNVLERMLGPVVPTTGGDTLLTPGAGEIHTIRTLLIVNTDVTGVTMRIGINGTADGDLQHPEVVIDAGGKAEFEGVIIVADGDTLDIDVDGAVTVSGHGLVQTP